MLSEYEMIARLVTATVAGALLGLERDARNRPAGARTHAMVALGCALFALTGSQGFNEDQVWFDSTRVAAAVVTGLGFIGAGTIITDGGSVQGLTTASTIWASGGLGIGYAAGAYVLSTVALLLAFIVLVALRPIRTWSERRGSRAVELVITYETGFGTLGPVISSIESAGLTLQNVRLQEEQEVQGRQIRELSLLMRGADQQVIALERMVEDLHNRPEVRSAEVRSN